MNMNEKYIEEVVRQVISECRRMSGKNAEGASVLLGTSETTERSIRDITSEASRAVVLIGDAADREVVERMKRGTPARIGVGCCGSRLKTVTMLQLRADHAAAKDAVFRDVGEGMLEEFKLQRLCSQCANREEYLTRPDLGRRLSGESMNWLRQERCQETDVQIVVSDGLSSTAVEANIPNLLPVLQEDLACASLEVGEPFFVRYGRVGIGDHIAEITGAKVVCVLLGERPGLATAESMSAYITYKARVGIAESDRTVVSNIHRNGMPAVEAGVFLSDLIQAIYKARLSGVKFRK